MNKRFINLIFKMSIIITILLLSRSSYAEMGVDSLEVDNDQEVLIAGKNVGCSIKNEGKPTGEANNAVNPNGNDLISSKIPMPIEHQKYLYNICEERGIDYVLMLSLIKHESEFKPNRISRTNDYGYMQINKMNHNRMIKELKTANAPLDPYVNINWGTHMIARLNNKYKNQGYSGEKLNRAVLSAYNKGEGGFKRTGEATGYLNRVNKERNWVKKTLGI